MKPYLLPLDDSEAGTLLACLSLAQMTVTGTPSEAKVAALMEKLNQVIKENHEEYLAS